ncbi:Hypothetical predicted protein [Paramuricea clavata]|uniref:Uncharacterized protein n=1 Tax=Paramuricea clavata TaxID=317549 RepID=A0A7D9LQY3_PARCT|nr:Hypothetical predicted protein [Paramuricea clavata]
MDVVSPITLEGKIIFRDVCKTKVPWDADIQEPLSRRWNEWEKSLPNEETIPRPIVKYREPVLNVELHTFGDASTKGVGAVVYSVVRQKSGNTQQLVTAKSRLAKEGLTINLCGGTVQNGWTIQRNGQTTLKRNHPQLLKLKPKWFERFFVQHKPSE